MKIASTLSDTPAAAALLLCMSLAITATARADIYKWNDEQGRTIFSNVAPTPSEKAKNVELLMKEAGPAAKAPAHAATPTEQALLGRIETLERQLQLPIPQAPAPMAPPATPYGTYYAPPPPTPAGYYADEYDYSSYYPSQYYPVPYYASSIYYPARAIVRRPVFATSRGGSFHGGSSHRGGGHGGRR